MFHLQIYNVACFDVLLEPLSLTDSIIDDMLFDTYSGGSYWLLFEGFFEPENNSLCEFLFNNLNGSADFSSYATACELSLFFSDSEYKKETYRQRIKISHHKNVIFELTTL